MNREKREKHERVLYDKFYTIQVTIFDMYPKTETVRLANTNFRDFRAFRGKSS